MLNLLSLYSNYLAPQLTECKITRPERALEVGLVVRDETDDDDNAPSG